jgi:hypothetical protein
MPENNWFPWILGAVLVGVLLAALFVPPDVFDVRPDREDPVAEAGPDLTVAFGQGVELDASGSSDDKGIESFEWMIENGAETVFLRGARVSFVFSAPGVYTVTLTVTDRADKQDTDSLTVTVQ